MNQRNPKQPTNNASKRLASVRPIPFFIPHAVAGFSGAKILGLAKWAKQKKPGVPYFPWNNGWLIGILILASSKWPNLIPQMEVTFSGLKRSLMGPNEVTTWTWILAYEIIINNPYITWVVFHPLYTQNSQEPFFHCSNGYDVDIGF